MLSELKVLDFIFIFLFGFVLAAIVVGFTVTSTVQSVLIEFMEIYALVLLFLIPMYIFLKSRAYGSFSYLVQEKLYILLFLVLVVLIGSLVVMNVYRDRKKPGGFIIFIVSVCVVLISILIYASNSAMNSRYALNMPNFETQQFQSRLR
tara:strand:- start:319 stop:765 length:447 start_codon:yes stop_codon:yes gene_type:complete